MDKLIIHGGKRLKGGVDISGAKNAALPIIAASLLASGYCTISNVPNLKDIMTMGRLLANLGAGFHYEDRKAIINTEKVKIFEAPYDLVRTMRASILVLGPLIARFGRAKVSLPGGCAIGARPINLHLIGLEKMGADIKLESGYVVAKGKRLKGTSIYLDVPTVTGTENLMMAASLAKGRTLLENAAREPEVVDLANALISMGARIKGAGESVIEIEGVDELKPVNYSIIPDRIEAGTFMAIAGITEGDIIIKRCRLDHLDASMMKLKEVGLVFEHVSDGIRVIGPSRPKAADVKTMPYPGFPTDMQAQFMAIMSIADGTSIIKETIFENRFMHVAELRRMGADIIVEGGTATVKGISKLKAAPLMATDLRASASLIAAALAAKGETTVHRLYHLDRGYENMEEKLVKIGADVKRVKE
ncbi:MAG: UDP-N-acetylglucosamine 1-carboxyvinyltransferase [Nitrospirae bacterium CG_4_10_14_0_8_um_filter_41_23]|nr:UDP-N-acetylglucosamine 1-carboxyvinyltransferase [Nitrospirota bacterium]OIP59642.1 MAG: UDP-N-acetylglucosamine 1-carboxyvinyltransferase [Nitrospirae bacterium CG2_30_41_42]PIQ93954.1 MAG: UDP-N-acetylglucosamine 1-carboxyvinyltransferase [Nitrospirae bacterium CG11_big_fil_rev_8_21_14_0_20_41_14]PIV44238.1 MAG: UDP-N-acetylglucosamine 1-carboxyvinyltransferase [Nitrospirae bacterium CG02_land_8_20_14_3_00_41_53]PIW86884.1 MAG: UDP-N-acetylglucosamine 1-carboxyvinyltransferase [Nitrospira